MSKHEKALKRERRKTERGRRALLRNPQSAIRNGGAALAAAAAIAAGTSAYASPVRFDNPAGAGHFDWTPNNTWLDLTLSPSGQPGNEGDPSSLGQFNDGSTSSVAGTLGTAMKVQVGGLGNYFAIGVDADTLIPSGAPWDRVGTVYYPGYGSELPAGSATYLGVQFDLGSGLQYGWIGVERTGMALDAFAWGYETEPGVSIPAGAPEPGTLALLAFGAAAALRKRRTA